MIVSQLCFADATGKLSVSHDGRYLVEESGEPFFYLGDTAWELFHRLNREEADHYLEDRAAKGFTVIQAVALSPIEGVLEPNAYGHVPLQYEDPSRPAVMEGPDNDYWDHVDYVVRRANELGMRIGLLPTWGRYWHHNWLGHTSIFTPDTAENFAEWVARRYRDAGVIWILGGDRPVETEAHREIIRRMAVGIRRGDGGRHLITFHPNKSTRSAQFFHDEPWLDFNMLQNGHGIAFNGLYSRTIEDYQRVPAKPIIDGEPVYEDHPIGFNGDEHGYSTAADVRRAMYWNLFSGAFGHTYGHHSVWQMWEPGRKPINGPILSWRKALQQPGAGQMRHGRTLMESRPVEGRIPDNGVIVGSAFPGCVPGAGLSQMLALRHIDGSYAMVYTPVSRPFSVNMDVIQSTEVFAWWYDPRTGEALPVGKFSNEGTREFEPPGAPGERLDWILVLDDISKGYPQINF